MNIFEKIIDAIVQRKEFYVAEDDNVKIIVWYDIPDSTYHKHFNKIKPDEKCYRIEMYDCKGKGFWNYSYYKDGDIPTIERLQELYNRVKV